MNDPLWMYKLKNGLLGTPDSSLLGEDAAKRSQADGLMSMGASLLAAGGPSRDPTSLGQALGPAILQGRQATQQSQSQALQSLLMKQQLSKVDKANEPPSAVQEYEYAKSNGFKGSFEEWKRVGSAQQMTPAAIQEWDLFKSLPKADQDAWVNFKRNSQPYQMVETATGKGLLNKGTGQLENVTTRDQEAAAAGQMEATTATAKIAGEASAQAKIDLPRVQDNAKQALQTIEDFEKHPGFNMLFGKTSLLPVVPGTDTAGARAYYNQIKGKTFLEAFNSLKGAGQITEIEGAKATDAIARLDTAQSEKEARAALKDLKEVIRSGSTRAEKKANIQPEMWEDGEYIYRKTTDGKTQRKRK